MAVIDINSLPLQEKSNLSDIFELYSDEDEKIVPIVVSYADLSSFFFTTEAFEQLKEKYHELLDLMNSFRKFINEKYPLCVDLPKLLSTKEYFDSKVSSLNSINNVKKGQLDNYCTYDYNDYKKAEAYSYHEKMASEMAASLRKMIVKNVIDSTVDANDDED